MTGQTLRGDPGNIVQVKKKVRKVKWFRVWRDQEDIINARQYAHLQNLDPSLQGYYAIRYLDGLDFQWLITCVAGAGFFVDGYLLFANNFALPILGFLYWKDDRASDHETAINCATLSGAIVGQVVLGVLADRYGRSKVYGWELLIIIVSSIAITMASEGIHSMRITPWLIFWRFIIGFGVGAEYPINSVLTSEFAPTPKRAYMLATVFMMQSCGQFFAALVTFSALAGNYPLDSIWRLLYGLAAVPAAVAIVFRLTIPESIRYTFDIERNPNKANRAIEALEPDTSTGERSQQPEQESSAEALDRSSNNAINSVGTQSDSIPGAGEGSQSRAEDRVESADRNEDGGRNEDIIESYEDRNGHAGPSSPSDGQSSQDEDVYSFPPKPSFDDFMLYFWEEGNWKSLAATAGTWFLLDLAFFGLGLNSPQIVTGVWKGCNSTVNLNTVPANFKWNSEPGVTPSNISIPIHSLPTTSTAASPTTTFFQMFEDNEIGFMVIVSIAAVFGSLLLIGLGNVISRKRILIGAFGILSLLFFILCGLFFTRVNYKDDTHYDGVYIAVNVFYAFCQFFFNLGPNPLTFMFPAEIFPTRYRCSCHGVSAACGKLGSVVAQLILIKIQFSALNDCQNRPDKALGKVLIGTGIFMIVGALLACLLPRVQARQNPQKNLSLEELAIGRNPAPRRRREEMESRGETIRRWRKRDLLPPWLRRRLVVPDQERQAPGIPLRDRGISSGTTPKNNEPYAGT